jgi:polysaccharide export outer membrane protein
METNVTAHVDAAKQSQPVALVPRKFMASLLLSLAAGLALAGCADHRGGDIPYDASHFKAPDPVVAVAAENAYRTGPGDTVTIVVMRVPDLSGDATIDPTGDITMPLIGKVPAIGKTTDQLASEISAKLSAKYLQNPEVRVALKASSSQHVTVDGSVNGPGIYPIAGSTTLLQAIAIAKGTAPDANSRKVAVFRTINGQRQAAAFDLTDIRRGKAPDPEIFGNDIIVVDGSVSKARFKDLLSTIPLISIFRPF